MKPSRSEKLILDEFVKEAKKMTIVTRGLSIGEMITMIRNQLKMSQTTLSSLAGVPQSTISHVERSKTTPKLSTLEKIFNALSCEIVILPIFKESIEAILRKQARKVAEKNILYLRGTMSLEKQEPDKKFLKQLIKDEEERLLRSPGNKLWKG